VPIEAGSLHYAVGPFIAVTVVILLGLFMRWAFGTGYGRRPPSAAADDEGLLTPVATLSRRESALALRAVLSDAGIRSTVRFPPRTGPTCWSSGRTPTAPGRSPRPSPTGT